MWYAAYEIKGEVGLEKSQMFIQMLLGFFFFFGFFLGDCFERRDCAGFFLAEHLQPSVNGRVIVNLYFTWVNFWLG